MRKLKLQIKILRLISNLRCILSLIVEIGNSAGSGKPGAGE